MLFDGFLAFEPAAILWRNSCPKGRLTRGRPSTPNAAPPEHMAGASRRNARGVDSSGFERFLYVYFRKRPCYKSSARIVGDVCAGKVGLKSRLDKILELLEGGSKPEKSKKVKFFENR